MSNQPCYPTPLAEELSLLMRDLEDRKGHSAWLIEHWPTVMAALRGTQSETARTVKYVRMPLYDKRIGRGDDYAGDAWLRWTAVDQIPGDLDASTSTVK